MKALFVAKHSVSALVAGTHVLPLRSPLCDFTNLIKVMNLYTTLVSRSQPVFTLMGGEYETQTETAGNELTM